MKVIGVIPARYASTRFPGKPLVDIRGKSMITRVYEACSASAMLDDVIVATDDLRIFEHLNDNNANVIMTDVKHLNGTERISEFAYQLKEDCLLINIQGDEPCIHPKQIDELVSFMLENKQLRIATLAKRINDESLFSNPNAVKVLVSNKVAIDFKRDKISQGNKHNIGKHIGIYGYYKKTLLKLVKLKPSKRELEYSLEQLRWMDNDYTIGVAWTGYESPSVDVPDDIYRVESFMDKNGLI